MLGRRCFEYAPEVSVSKIEFRRRGSTFHGRLIAYGTRDVLRRYMRVLHTFDEDINMFTRRNTSRVIFVGVRSRVIVGCERRKTIINMTICRLIISGR